MTDQGHKFTDDEVAEFQDAFELFDKTGEGIIPYFECANLARCFGYDPLDSQVRILLGGGDEDKPATKEDMQTKSISFQDYLPILWAISQQPAPGNREDFMECLKVKQLMFQFLIFEFNFRPLTRMAMALFQLPTSDV